MVVGDPVLQDLPEVLRGALVGDLIAAAELIETLQEKLPLAFLEEAEASMGQLPGELLGPAAPEGKIDGWEPVFCQEA